MIRCFLIRKRIILAVLTILIASLASQGCGNGVRSESVELVILHVNDSHGHLLPFDFDQKKDVGGMARMATLIKEIRNENRKRTLVLHAGDIFSRGQPLTVYYGGKVDILAMDAIGFDALTPGNGDFYTGIDLLLEQTRMVSFPTVLANVYFKEGRKRLFPPSIIKEVAGVKIAILGVGFIRMNHPSVWSLEIENPIKAARDLLPGLREKADLVIALTHIGLGQDKMLAEACPEVDIIVGSHSHSVLESPVRIPRPEGKGEVVIVQAGIFGQYLGKMNVRLKLDRQNKYAVERVEGKLLPVDSTIRDDKDIAELIERYSKPLSEVICVSKVTLPDKPAGELTTGNLMVTAISSSCDGEVTLLNRDAVHGGIRPGDITLADVCQVHQWRSRALEITLTGSQLQQLLAQGNVFSSGCSYRSEDGKIVDLKINSSPVDLARLYRVAADESLLMNTPSLQGITFRETGERVDTALIKYLKKIKIISEK